MDYNVYYKVKPEVNSKVAWINSIGLEDFGTYLGHTPNGVPMFVKDGKWGYSAKWWRYLTSDEIVSFFETDVEFPKLETKLKKKNVPLPVETKIESFTEFF